jgi:formate/nitrite transporter
MRTLGHSAPDAQTEAVALNFDAYTPQQIAKRVEDSAAAKVSLPFWKAFVSGVLCNALVCMAVWLSLAGRSVIDKAIAIVLPISAFVAAGFEHCVANMYFIPLGIFLCGQADTAAIAGSASLDWSGYVHNLVPVIAGNIVGGSGLVALVYYLVFLSSTKQRIDKDLRHRARATR